ncbi:MAG: PD-(D/E)XK nuclease-like domain-containing protein [Pirellulales bacterium]|nr:PD-(D/E)XK nuclease-like domain-containing protein [Pirellulales bacterium]
MTVDKSLIDLKILETEPAEEYHAKADSYLSSHQLIDFIRCPYLYAKRRAGLVERKETPAYFIGNATHCRILEGFDVLKSRFALGGPINPSTGKPYGSTTKKFAEWRAKQGKPVLSYDQLDLIENMAEGVSLCEAANELLQYGRAEGVVRAEYCGVPCQIRIDWAHPHFGIVDLKTTADLDWFENEARRHHYHNQLAFYQAVLRQVVGDFVPVYLIGVEKIEPFRCGVWRVSDDTLSIARGDNESAITRLVAARESDTWTTGYETPRLLEIA